RFHTPASRRRVIHSRLPSGGRTTMGKSRARARIAMSATVSMEKDECSMSTRTKSRPAERSRVSTAGVRIIVTQVPSWTSPRSARAGRGALWGSSLAPHQARGQARPLPPGAKLNHQTLGHSPPLPRSPPPREILGIPRHEHGLVGLGPLRVVQHVDDLIEIF